MKTKIISILWWSLTHPVALLTTLAKLGCSLAIIFALVVSVCEIKIDFIEQGKKALISEIFNAGYSSSNTSLTVASLRDFQDYDFDCDDESNLSFKIDPELEQQLAAATDMHHDFDYSQPIVAPLGSQERFSLSDSTVFNLDKNINSGISYQNFNDKGFALIDSINEYTKAHPELQNDPHYQARIKAQIAQIYFNSTLLPEHMSADIGLAHTIAAITEKEAPSLEPAPASNSRANKNKVAVPQEFAHNSQETIPCSEPITEQITEPTLAANDLTSNNEAHSPYGYQDPDYSNDNQNAYQHHNCQKNNSLYSSLNSSSFTSNSLNGSYNHGYSQSHGNSYSHSHIPNPNQHESKLKSTTNNNLNRNLKNTRDDLYLAQEGKSHHHKSLASTNSSLKGQTYAYSRNHNLKPDQALKSLSTNSRSSSNYALEPNANLAMSNTTNSALTNHGLISSDGILEEEEEELVLALPGSKSLTPSQAATITTSSASQNHMLSQANNVSHGYGYGQDYDLNKGKGKGKGQTLSVSQNQGLSHSLSYSNSFEQEPTLAQTQDAYYSQANTNKIASDKAQLCLSASESLGSTISASKPSVLTNSSVTSTAPNTFASLSSLASLASANSSSYQDSTLSMANIATSGSNSSYHHSSQSTSTTLSSSTGHSSSTSINSDTGSSTLSSSISSNIHPNSNLNNTNTNSYHNNSNNSRTGISSSQSNSSHYAIALAPTIPTNAMSTDHTISTAMVAALTTNTDPATISTSISTSTNTATTTANTDVSATGTTATGPATTITSTDIAPATATVIGTGTTTVTRTTANGSDGLATANTIGTSNSISTGTGTGSAIAGTGSDGSATANTIGTSNSVDTATGTGIGTKANGSAGLAAANTIGTSNGIGTATATVADTGTTANDSDGLAAANTIGTSNSTATATATVTVTGTTANGSDGLATANTIGTSNIISTGIGTAITGTGSTAIGSAGLATANTIGTSNSIGTGTGTATGTGISDNGSDGLATANTIGTSNGIGTATGTGIGTKANGSDGLVTDNTIGTSIGIGSGTGTGSGSGTATDTGIGTKANGSDGLAATNTIGTSNGIGTGSGTVISGTGTTANGSYGFATANTMGTSNGIGSAITSTGTTANGSNGLATANTIGTSNGNSTGSDITGTGTGTAMGAGAVNSGDYDSEVAYLYRLDEELFDEEVERWDLEALQQLDLVIEDPEINLTAQDYQIIDEVMSTIDELRASGIAVDLDTVQMLCEHYMPQPYGTILLNNTKHEHLLSLLKSKQAKEQAKLTALQPNESLVTELKDHSHPSKAQLDATLGAISNLATEQTHSLSKVNAHTGTNYTTNSGYQPLWGHSVFSVTNMVADDYIASMALESNTLYASLNTNMGANLGSPYSNALAYNYHDRLKSFNSSHSHSTSDSHSPDYNPNGAPVAEIAPAAIDTQVTSPAETNTAATGGNLRLDDAYDERVDEEASLNFEDFGIKEVAPVTPLMTAKQEPNNFLLLPKPIVLSKDGIVGLFSYPKRPVITQDALVINMRTYEKTYGSDYKQCLQMLGHWPDIQSLLTNYVDNGAKGLTPAALGIIKINNMLNAHHYWSDPLNISTTFFSLYHYCKDLDSGLIAPRDHHGIDVLKQLYVLSINSPSTLWCSPAHMLTYKQVTKHPAQDSNNGQAIFANSNVASSLNYPIHTQAASAPVLSTAETTFQAQSESQAINQSELKALAQANVQSKAQAHVPSSSSSSGSTFYQGKGPELAPRYGKELAPTVESGLELGHSQGHGHGYGQVPSQEQALREEQHYESLLDDTNSESNYYELREQEYPCTANPQGLNQGYNSYPNSSPSSSSQQGSSNLLGQKPCQEQGNWSGNRHGYSYGQGQGQDYAHGQDLGWENSKEMERNKSLGMDYSREYEGHSPEAMMGTIPYEQSKQDGIELLGRTFNNSDDAKQALDQALGLSTAYDKHSYTTNHISYQTNALNGVKPLAKASYNPTDLNEALDKQLIFNDLSYELMLPVYESLTEYQQAILESCQPWLLNKKLLSYDKERAFASILQNLTKLIKLKVLSPKEAYALAHGQRPKLLKEQDIVAFAIIGQIVKQAHENHQGKFTKEQAHDLKLLKQALYYAKWPLLEQCIDPNFAYRYSKIRLKYGYQGQIINPLSFITDTLEPHLSHSPSSNTSHGQGFGFDQGYGYGYGYSLSSNNNIAKSTGLGLSPSTGTSTGHKLSSGHKLSTRAKLNLGSRWESDDMGHAPCQQHKQPEQQMLQQQQQQYGNALAMNGNQIVNEDSCQEDNAQVINEVLNTAQNLRSMYQDLKTLEHGDILNSAQTIINAANRVGNNLPLNKSSTNDANSIPNQSSITDINQVFATGPAPSTNTTNSTQSPTQ